MSNIAIEEKWCSWNLLKKQISWKENLKKRTSFIEEKGRKYIQENFVLALLSSAVFLLRKPVSGFFWSVLLDRLKAYIRVLWKMTLILGTWTFPQISWLKIKFSENWDSFVDKRTLITAILISSCHWKPFLPFCLQKKRIENTFLTLIKNYCKILQKNKLWQQ